MRDHSAFVPLNESKAARKLRRIPSSPGPLERRIPEPPGELLLAHVFEQILADAVEGGIAAGTPRMSVAVGEALVPGAHVVADVAAEGLALEAARPAPPEWALLLDRQVGNAAGGVQHPGRHQGIRGARVEAAGTAAAAVELERRSPARSGRSVKTEPMKKNEPASGRTSIVFLPIHPRPARWASSRSGTGPASAKVRAQSGAAAREESPPAAPAGGR